MKQHLLNWGFVTGSVFLFNTFVFSQAGQLDPTFDNDGIAITDIAGDYDAGYAVDISENGTIIVGGSSGSHIALAQYLSDGTLNPAFGINGTATVIIGEISEARSVLVLTDNSILISGYAYGDNFYDFAIARCLPNGTLDSSFGMNGIVATDLANADEDYAYSMVLQDDGKIILGGYIGYSESQDFALARYHANGIPDSSFGLNGIVITDLLSDYDAGKNVAIQPDGKILLAGNNDGVPVILRYYPDGTLDYSFNGTGYVQAFFSEGASGNDVEVQADGKILLAGSIYEGIKQLFVMRYSENGVTDSTFGNNGVAKISFDSTTVSCNSMVLPPDGKIIVGGSVTYTNGSGSDLIVCRLKDNGDLDSTFNTTGCAITNIDVKDVCNAVALQPDGKLIAAGITSSFNGNPYPASHFVTTRYLTGLFLSDPNTPEKDLAVYLYPNPLFDHGMFKYELSESATVTLQLIDVSGRHLKTFFSENKSAGLHFEELNLTGIDAGAYLLQFRMNERVHHIKISKQ